MIAPCFAGEENEASATTSITTLATTSVMTPEPIKELANGDLFDLVDSVPAEPASLPDRNSTGGYVPIEQRPRSEHIASEIKHRLYDADRVTESDQDAFIAMAKGEPASVLTDQTSIRGEMYHYVLNALLEQGRLSFEDEHWVRSVHHLVVEHRKAWFPSESAYASIEVRRLVRKGQWKVRIHRTVFVRNGPLSKINFKGLRPEGLPINGWWDGLIVIYTPYGINSSYHWGGTPPTSFDRTIEGIIYEGDPYADIWWPVAKIKHPIEFQIASQSMTDNEKGFDNPDARYDALDGSEVIEDPEPYIQWL